MLNKFFKRDNPTAAIPDGVRAYAIGDIHGCATLLNALLNQIAEDAGDLSAAQLIFLGDYVDRGPDSRGVIDRLLTLRKSYPGAIFLKGNHEASMLDFLNEPEDLPHWLEWGGEETLESYGVNTVGVGPTELAHALREKLPPAHLDFLNALRLTHQLGDYLFVHAGVRPGIALANQSEEDLLWIRTRFHNASTDERPEFVVVHGHQPEDNPVDAGWRIGVDTGACYGGALTAVALEGSERRFISVKA